MKPSLRLLLVFALGGFCVCGCRKEGGVGPPQKASVVESGLLSIQHLRHGLEQFKVTDARCNLYQGDDGVWEFVVMVASGDATLRAKELADLFDAKPHFEATALMPADRLALVAGRIVTQQEGYDHQRDTNLSNIYYWSHNPVEELRVELIEVTEEWIDAKVTGKALINGDNGTKPDATISVRVKFKRDKELRRGIG